MGGVVRIKVQSNAMPNHCINSTVNNAVASENEWEVNFNPDMSSIQNYSTSDFGSSAATDEILCDLQRTAATNMNSASNFVMGSRRML